MKKISLYLLGVLTVFLVAWKTSDNVLKFGDASNGTNKELIFDIGLGATNPKIVFNTTSGKLTFTNDGVNSKDIGSGSGSGSGGTNLLENGGCENGTSTPDDWTASGGSLSRTTVAASVGYETASCIWNASASSQTLTSSDTAVVNGIEGNTCVATGRYLYNGTTGDYVVRVEDDAGNALSADVSLNYSTLWTSFMVSFPCPSDDSIRLEFASAVADPGDLYLDNMHLGSNNAEIESSQASIVGVGYFAGTASCAWSRANTAVGAFGTDTDCPAITVEYQSTTGMVSTADTDLPQISFPNLPAGVYEVSATMTIDGSAGADSQVAISDGTTTGGSLTGQSTGTPTRQHFSTVGVFSYSSSGARTFSIHGAVASGTLQIVNSGSGLGLLSFKVKRFPQATELGVKSPDTQGALLRAYHANNCDWSNTTSTSFTSGTADASCTFTTEKTNGFSGVKSEDTGVLNTNYPGIVFTPPHTGNFMVCAQTILLVGTSNAYGTVRLYDGTNTLAELSGRAAGTSGASPYHICGVLEVSSVSSKTVKLQARTDSGLHNISAGASTAGGRGAVEWTIYPLTQNFPSAVLLSSFDPTRVSTNAAASKMGVKTYACDVSGGSRDIAYNNGNKCTVSNNGSGAVLGSAHRMWVQVWQDMDGVWFMNLRATFQWNTTDSNEKYAQILGVTFKNATFNQAIISKTFNTGSCGYTCPTHYPSGGYLVANDDYIVVPSGAGTFNGAHVEFNNVELESKPNFVY